MANALFVVGQRRFVQTMRKAGADLDELKEVNRAAAKVTMPAVSARTPRKTGKLARSVRIGATRKAGVVRAGTRAVPYAGPINYGWPARHIHGVQYANDGVAATEPQWTRLYEDFVKKVMNQVEGA